MVNKESPGPAKYLFDNTGDRIKLSRSKLAQKYSMPKQDRGLLSQYKKVEGPSPSYYQNSTEVSKKTTLKRSGCYSMGRQERKLDFSKFSSMHSVLVNKGYY